MFEAGSSLRGARRRDGFELDRDGRPCVDEHTSRFVGGEETVALDRRSWGTTTTAWWSSRRPGA
jgi:hypothetical protein